MRRAKILVLAAALAAAGLVASCGGGSSTAVDSLAPEGVTALSADAFGYLDGSGGAGDSGAGGGAGDGSPIRKAVIIVTDATGKSVSGLTDDNGNYFVKFSNFTSPIVAKVVDAGGNVLTSVTEEKAETGKAVRIMINPLTDKIVSDTVVSGTVPGTDKNFDGSKIDLAKLAQAKKDLLTSVGAALSSVGITSTVFDPIKSKYSYDGTGVDAIIESISHTRDAGTGATLLRAKLVSVDSGTNLITAGNPLAASYVASPSSPALTFAKMQNWITELNRCLALTPAQISADAGCNDSNGDRIISNGYRNNSKDFEEDTRTIHSNSDNSHIQGTTFRNPVLLFTAKYPGSTASYDDLAVMEVTIRQPSTGPKAGSLASPVEYTKNLVFKRDDTLTQAKAGNWILHGNQRNFDLSADTRFHRFTQINSAKSANSPNNLPSMLRSSINFFVNTSRYNTGTQSYVNANIRAVRVTGPGLPAAGLVLTPTNVAGEGGRLAIHNSTGSVSATTMTTSLAQSDFRLNAVALDGSALSTQTWVGQNMTPGFGGGNAWASPLVTDFSALQAYTRYQFDIFLNTNPGNTTPDATEYSRIGAPIMSPSAALTLPMNDMMPSAPMATAPQGTASSVLVQWTNNLNAGPMNSVYVYAEEGNPKGTNSTINKWNYSAGVAAAYSVNNRPTSQTVSVGANPAFPSLVNATPGDYREIGSLVYQGRARVQSSVFWSN